MKRSSWLPEERRRGILMAPRTGLEPGSAAVLIRYPFRPLAGEEVRGIPDIASLFGPKDVVVGLGGSWGLVGRENRPVGRVYSRCCMWVSENVSSRQLVNRARRRSGAFMPRLS